MGFAERWDDAQREAVIAAALDHELTYKEVAKRAAEGALPGVGARLEPFPMPHGTVAAYCRDERRRRGAIERASSAPDVVLAEGIGTLATIFGERVAKLSKAKDPDMAEARKVAAAGREILALQRDLHKTKAQKPTGDPANSSSTGAEGDAPAGFVQSLVS